MRWKWKIINKRKNEQIYFQKRNISFIILDEDVVDLALWLNIRICMGVLKDRNSLIIPLIYLKWFNSSKVYYELFKEIKWNILIKEREII